MLEANKGPKDATVFESAYGRLEKASHKMAEALYKSASAAGEGAAGGAAPGAGDGGAAGGGAGGGGEGGTKDDVIDAEYTEGPK